MIDEQKFINSSIDYLPRIVLIIYDSKTDYYIVNTIKNKRYCQYVCTLRMSVHYDSLSLSLMSLNKDNESNQRPEKSTAKDTNQC